MALTDLTRISTSGIATGSTIDSPILRKDVDFRGNEVGVTSALFDSSERRLDFKDNVKLRFGDSADLNLFHNASDSVISHSAAGEGSLKILSGGAIGIECVKAGAVNIAHNGSTKIETTSHGAVVTGVLTATSFSGPVVGNTNNASGISTFYDLRISNNLTVEGTTTTLDTNVTGVDRLEINANSNTETAIVGIQSGTADIVNLFDGNTEVLTVTDGGKVGIGTVTPSQKLSVYGNIYQRGNDYITWNNGDSQIGGVSGYHFAISTYDGSSEMLERVRITGGSNGGRVGIGTNNPQTELEVHGDSGGTIRLAKGGTNRTTVLAGDTLGKIQFRSYDASLNYNSYSGTYAEIETVVTNDLAGLPSEEVRLDFKIADSDEPASGKVITPVPALSILQGGSVGIGSTLPDYSLDVAGSIGFSGQTRGLTQSASSPTYSFDGDSDTGMYRGNGVNILSFATAGQERLSISATGDLTLQGGKIYGEDNASNSLHLQSTSGNSNHSRIEIGTGHASDNGGIHFYTAGSSVATQRMVIKGTSGSVGIGTDTPNAKLSISGGSIGSGAISALELKHVTTNNTGDGTAILFNAGYQSNPWAFAKISATNWTGGYGADLQVHIHPANGTQSSSVVKALSIVGDGGSGALIRIPNGRIGIGSTGTDQRLQVSGNIELNAYEDSNGQNNYKTSGGLIIGNAYDADKGSLVNADRNAIIWQERGLDIDFGTTNAFRMKIKYDGNVGIATDISGGGGAYGRLSVVIPSQSGGSALQVMNSAGGSGDGSLSNIVLRSVNNIGTQWADAEYRASQHIFAIQSTEKVRITSTGNLILAGITTSNTGFMFGDNGQHYLYQSASDTVSLRITGDGPYAEFKDSSGDVQMGSGSGTLRLSAGGNEKARLSSAGEFHIEDRNSSNTGEHFFQAGAFGIRMEDTGGYNRWNIERNYGGYVSTPVIHLSTQGTVGINTDKNLNGQLTVNNTSGFNSASMSTNTDNIFLQSNTATADGAYGASIGFARVQYSDRRAAAIATVQEGTDEDLVGLAFFTHDDANATAAVVEKFRITPKGTMFIASGTKPKNQCEARTGSGDETLGLMVKRSICFSDSDTKGQGMVMVSHTKSITADGTTSDMITIRNREGCFIGDIYVGYSASGSAAVRHKKFHTYYNANTVTDVNNPGGRISESINCDISSNNDVHTVRVTPNNSSNVYQGGSTLNVTMSIIALSAGAPGSDNFTVTYH